MRKFLENVGFAGCVPRIRFAALTYELRRRSQDEGLSEDARKAYAESYDLLRVFLHYDGGIRGEPVIKGEDDC